MLLSWLSTTPEHDFTAMILLFQASMTAKELGLGMIAKFELVMQVSLSSCVTPQESTGFASEGPSPVFLLSLRHY